MLTALDATYSIGSNLSGVGVYSRRLLFGLASGYPASRFLFCYRPHRFLRAFHKRLPDNVKRRPLFERLTAHRGALFHGLNQRLPSGRWKHKVATFHDLFVLTGDYSTPEFRTRFATQARQAAERADLVIAVSQFTAAQVTDLLHVERSRVRVIHHGAAVAPRPARVQAASPKRVLHIGALQRRKNLVRLVEAFERIDSDWILTLAGSDGFAAEEIRRRIRESPARDRIELPGYLPDTELETLWANSSIFAFPSLDEGFGMPVLEAMARGLPVLTSNRSALPEVAGEAAVLVDPFDVEEISGNLRLLMSKQQLRSDLAELGRKRASCFRWETAVAETWAVYREICA